MKQNKPVISVIMSAYNAEKYVGESIESIINQTFKNWELIIFEDGSIDNTKEIITKYSKKDSRIKAFFNKKNIGYIGFIKNLNNGIKLSKGKYIARMDADDICMVDRLEKQYYLLEKNPSLFLVGSGAKIINEKGNVTGRFNPLSNSFLVFLALHIKNCIYHPTIMFRNEKLIWYREKMLYAE